jgi:hypothetical protein
MLLPRSPSAGATDNGRLSPVNGSRIAAVRMPIDLRRDAEGSAWYQNPA